MFFQVYPFILCLLLSFFLETLVQAQGPATGPDEEEETKVYLTEEEALQKAFPKADTVWAESWVPSDDQRRTVERRLGWRLKKKSFQVYRGIKDGDSAGFAMVTEQIGLYKPITFIVKVTPEGSVESVWIMVYRESRGGEIRRRRFLSQYKGKNVRNSIRINRDIVGVTGATLSVRAVNAGVKKVLALIEVGYLKKGTH